MEFTAVVAEVLSIVKRPDKLSDIRREVNSALNFFCCEIGSDYSYQEALVPLVATEYTQTIAVTVLPRLWKIQYIRRAGTTQYLKKLDLNNLAQSSCDMRDKWYRAGTNLNISMTALAANLDIGYHQFPPILDGTAGLNEYWLLEAAWPSVINRATAAILHSVGDPSGAKEYKDAETRSWLAFYNRTKNQE